MGIEDAKRGRKRAVVDHETAKPPAKRPAIAGDSSAPEQQERVRSDVRALLESYNVLISKSGGAVDSGAFQALLKAAQGEVTSQRLAARLVPRFIALFPDQVEVAASALIKLSERYQEHGDSDQPLEEHTRRDALQGLQAVLLAASSGTPHGSQAVKLILTVLFRLLSQSEAEAPSTEELEEEEGEVASADGQAAAAAAGPWVRKVLRQSLQHHPLATLTFCFGCLTPPGRSSSSSSSPASLGVVQGVRLWLREHILREATPSREGTPMDCDAGTPRAADGAASAARSCSSLAAAAAAGAAGIVNGGHVHKAAAAAGCGSPRSCVLQSVLASSADLRAWVRREAKGLSRAPEEMKAVLQAAVQLLPPERPSSKRPSPTGSPKQQQQRPAPFGNQVSRPQQPPQYQQPSPQQQQQQQLAQHKAPNGVAQRQVNGMEPIGRSWSTPSPSGRGPRGQTALGRPPDPAAAAAAAAAAAGGGPGWGQLPRPAGPICRLEPCVLLTNVPWHVKQQDLQQQLQAAEAWILDTQPPGGAGSSSSGGARACCVLKAPLDSARTYMRHHKASKLAPQSPPVQVLFASSLPSCSRAAAAAANAPSLFIWVLRAVAGDAEKVTDDLREAGLVPKNVSRVNHSVDPGTVLEAFSAKEAADILAFLLKRHSAAVAAAAVAAAAAQQQQPQEELPPLPPEPPPGEWTPAGNRGGKPPSTPSAAAAGGGAGPPRQSLQQHQPGPSPLGGPSPLQQQQGYGPPGVRRTSSLPIGGGTPAGPNSKLDGGWRPGGPGHGSSNQGGWGTPGSQQQQWGPPGSQQQQWGQPGASPGQGPPGNEAGGRPRSQHGTPPHHHMQQQQQQGRRPQGGGQPGGSAGGAQGMSPFPGPPLARQQQQQALQRQHSYAGVSPSSSTPSHAGSPAGPGQVPPGPPGQMQQQYAGAQVLWRGQLLKSGIPVGTVCCVEALPGGHRQSGTAPEPRHWPDVLQVNNRTKVSEVLEQFVGAAPHTRAVRVLIPQELPPGNAQAIQQFAQYLTTKDRAGMVKLPGGHGFGPRALYLVVPQADVCQTLQVPWDGRCLMLIVVVVPHTLVGGGGGSGGGAAGPRGVDPPGGFAHGYGHGHGHHPGYRPMR